MEEVSETNINYIEVLSIEFMTNIAKAFITAYTEPVVRSYLTGLDSNKYLRDIETISTEYKIKFKFAVPYVIYTSLSEIEKVYLILGTDEFFKNVPVTSDSNLNIPIFQKMHEFEDYFEKMIYVENNYKTLYKYVAPCNCIVLEHNNNEIYSNIYIPPLMEHVTWLNDPTNYSIWKIIKKTFYSKIMLQDKQYVIYHNKELHNIGLTFTREQYTKIKALLDTMDIYQTRAAFLEMASRKKPITTMPLFYQSNIYTD